jgi:Potato inhibitor I family
MRFSVLIKLPVVALCLSTTFVDAASFEQKTDDRVGRVGNYLTSDTMPLDAKRTSWAELVGTNGEDAMAQLNAVFPDKNIVLVPDGNMVTMDYRTDRIRIFVDDQGKVAHTPRLG